MSLKFLFPSKSILSRIIVFSCLVLTFSVSQTALAQKSENTKNEQQEADQRGKLEGSYIITISTTMGNIEVLLYDETPLHRDNFLSLIEQEYYNGILFHRVINGFVIQAGDPDSRGAEPNIKLGEESFGATVEAEILPGIIHRRGVFAAAREGDDENPDRRSSGSHFYIALTDTPHLDGKYTIYGEMIKGEKVLEKIACVDIDENDRPVNDVIINKVTVKKLNKPRKSELE